MSKLGCICGHVIVDQSDSLPYKATFFRGHDDQQLVDQITRDTEDLAIAASADRLVAHIANSYPDGSSITVTDFIADRISSAFAILASDMYECEGCGRIWLQKKGANTFVSFRPDDGNYNAILAG